MSLSRRGEWKGFSCSGEGKTGHKAMCETTLHYDVIYVGRKRVLNLHIHNDTTLSEFGRLLTSCDRSCKFLFLVSCSEFRGITFHGLQCCTARQQSNTEQTAGNYVPFLHEMLIPCDMAGILEVDCTRHIQDVSGIWGHIVDTSCMDQTKEETSYKH